MLPDFYVVRNYKSLAIVMTRCTIMTFKDK